MGVYIQWTGLLEWWISETVEWIVFILFLLFIILWLPYSVYAYTFLLYTANVYLIVYS